MFVFLNFLIWAHCLMMIIILSYDDHHDVKWWSSYRQNKMIITSFKTLIRLLYGGVVRHFLLDSDKSRGTGSRAHNWSGKATPLSNLGALWKLCETDPASSLITAWNSFLASGLRAFWYWMNSWRTRNISLKNQTQRT